MIMYLSLAGTTELNCTAVAVPDYGCRWDWLKRPFLIVTSRQLLGLGRCVWSEPTSVAVTLEFEPKPVIQAPGFGSRVLINWKPRR